MGKDRAICLTHGFSYVRFRGVSDIRLIAMSGKRVHFADTLDSASWLTRFSCTENPYRFRPSNINVIT